jgi:hypothetical protein
MARNPVVQFKQGKLNFTTLVDIPEGAAVLTGTFFVRGHPVKILFDSGATHSFITGVTFFSHQRGFYSIHRRKKDSLQHYH